MSQSVVENEYYREDNFRDQPMYFVNGYKFHTVEWSNSRSTKNFGVCVPRTGVGSSEIYYYRKIIDIIELEYADLPTKGYFCSNVNGTIQVIRKPKYTINMVL